jgi:1,4-alpha-glucan branching enzyme
MEVHRAICSTDHIGPYIDKKRGGCVFRVWAPNADYVQICGQWDNWIKCDLHPDKQPDFYSIYVAEAKSDDAYRFFIKFEGTAPGWYSDPRSVILRMCETFHCYNSVVYDDSVFVWTDDGFEMPEKSALVLYQLHIASFGSSDGEVYGNTGTFLTCIERLDHLATLGINCIALLPISKDACSHVCWYF